MPKNATNTGNYAIDRMLKEKLAAGDLHIKSNATGASYVVVEANNTAGYAVIDAETLQPVDTADGLSSFFSKDDISHAEYGDAGGITEAARQQYEYGYTADVPAAGMNEQPGIKRAPERTPDTGMPSYRPEYRAGDTVQSAPDLSRSDGYRRPDRIRSADSYGDTWHIAGNETLYNEPRVPYRYNGGTADTGSTVPSGNTAPYGSNAPSGRSGTGSYSRPARDNEGTYRRDRYRYKNDLPLKDDAGLPDTPQGNNGNAPAVQPQGIKGGPGRAGSAPPAGQASVTNTGGGTANAVTRSRADTSHFKDNGIKSGSASQPLPDKASGTQMPGIGRKNTVSATLRSFSGHEFTVTDNKITEIITNNGMKLRVPAGQQGAVNKTPAYLKKQVDDLVRSGKLKPFSDTYTLRTATGNIMTVERGKLKALRSANGVTVYYKNGRMSSMYVNGKQVHQLSLSALPAKLKKINVKDKSIGELTNIANRALWQYSTFANVLKSVLKSVTVIPTATALNMIRAKLGSSLADQFDFGQEYKAVKGGTRAAKEALKTPKKVKNAVKNTKALIKNTKKAVKLTVKVTKKTAKAAAAAVRIAIKAIKAAAAAVTKLAISLFTTVPGLIILAIVIVLIIIAIAVAANMSKAEKGAYDFSDAEHPNALKTVQYLINKDWTLEAACGAVGGFMQESGCNPNSEVHSSINGNRLDTIGIAQYTNGNYDAFLSWCEDLGYDRYDLDTQAAYWADEYLEDRFVYINSTWTYCYYTNKPYKGAINWPLYNKAAYRKRKCYDNYDDFRMSDSIENCVVTMLIAESPATESLYLSDFRSKPGRMSDGREWKDTDGYMQAEVLTRLDWARKIYNEYQEYIKSHDMLPFFGTGGTIVACNDTASGCRGVPLIAQTTDYTCSCTSLAMVVDYLTGTDVANEFTFYYDLGVTTAGSGSEPGPFLAVLERYRSYAEDIIGSVPSDPTTIRGLLKQGYVLLMHADPGRKCYNGGLGGYRWTNGGHFYVLAGISGDAIHVHDTAGIAFNDSNILGANECLMSDTFGQIIAVKRKAPPTAKNKGGAGEKNTYNNRNTDILADRGWVQG